MRHLDSSIPSNIYYTSIGSKIPRFDRTASDSNTFIRLSNQLLKRMQKQGSKHRSIIFMLNKRIGKHYNVFNVFCGHSK